MILAALRRLIAIVKPPEGPVPVEPDAPFALVRAVSFMQWQTATRKGGARVEYGLGFGGKDPSADHPFQRDGAVWRCDCSGMVCAAIERPRLDKESGRWWNTDELERLAKLGGLAWMDALPGDIVVYGAGAKIGHCGIVSAVDALGPSRVIHCRAGKAIVETDAELFRRKGARILRVPV